MKRKARVIAGLAALIVLLAVLFLMTRTKERPAETSVTIAANSSIGSSLIYIAHWHNYFRAEGVNAVIVNYASGKNGLASVFAGRSDFAVVSGPPIAIALLDGKQPLIVATLGYSGKLSAVIARKDRGIGKPEDLRGKTIAVEVGSSADYYLDTLLLFHHLTRATVRIIEREPGQLARTLKEGEADAVAATYPFTVQVEKALGDNTVTFLEDWLYNEACDLDVSASLASKEPETVVKVVRALKRALAYARNHQSDAQAIVERSAGLAPGELTPVWSVFNLDLSLNESLIEYLSGQINWAQSTYFPRTVKPNPLDAVYDRALRNVDPSAVSLPERRSG